MNYELTFLITTKLDEKEIDSLIKQVEEKMLEKTSITKSIPPKRITLAYEIKKETEACLKTIEFEGSPENIEEIKNSLEKENKILRYLLIKKEKQAKTEKLNEEAKKEIK